MPTDLPRTKRKTYLNKTHLETDRPTPTTPKQKLPLSSILLNSFMVGSVLILVALVLLQEKRFADGTPGTVADAFIQRAQAAIVDSSAAETGDSAAN